jgi:hypothetical protein
MTRVSGNFLLLQNASQKQNQAWERELEMLRLDPKVREAVRAAVSAASAYKGYPWSQTEFDASAAGFRGELCKKFGEDAGKAFDQVLDKVPVRNGRFNSWSGD